MVSGQDILSDMIGGSQQVPDVAGSSSRDRRLQYWHKCPGCEVHTEEHNWVCLGPVMSPNTANEYYEFEQFKHAKPLPQYGQYLAGRNRSLKYDITDAAQRFRSIIEENGIGEFPVDQMTAYNWHRFPVIVKARPELANVVDIKCEHGCANRLFTNPDDYQRHISVMHKEVAQPEAIGRQFSSALEKMGTNQINSPEMIASIVAAVMQAMATKPPVAVEPLFTAPDVDGKSEPVTPKK